MKKKLIIIGASGHGKVVVDIAIKMKLWEDISFLDDVKSGESVMGIPVIGNTSDTLIYMDKADFFIAIGNNITRQLMQTELENQGATFATLTDPSAIIGTDVHIGAGSVVMAGVVINCSSRLGKSCIINTSSSLDHDSIIEDYVHISPGSHLAGTVKVCEGTWVGIGSTVTNNVTICRGCIIGAGSVVTSDINETGTYVGTPARKLIK